MELYTNSKRKKKAQLKRKDKIYLLRKNLKNLRLSKKLDYKKISLFVIKRKKGEINYKLELLKESNIYPVFHILLLKSADLRTPVSIKNSTKLVREDKYEVEKIIDYNPNTQ